MRIAPAFISISFILGLAMHSPAQKAQWIQHAAFGQNLSSFSKMAIDAQNNLYVVGSCNGTITVGASSVLPSAFNSFLTAYDESGNLLWSKTWAPAGNGAFLQVRDVAVDAAGDIYVCGQLYGALSIGNASVSSVGFDIYLAKFDNTGNLLWLKKYGGTQCDEWMGGGDLYADAGGNIYLCGTYDGLGAVFGAYTLSYTPQKNSFIVKLDASGNVNWARSFKDATNNAHCLTSDNNGHLYVGGLFTNATAFDTFTLTTPSSATGNDFYLAQLDDQNGNCNWVKGMAKGLYSVYPSVCTDLYGNIYYSGSTYGPFSVGTLTLTTSGVKGYIVKFDSNGNAKWIKELKSTNNSMVWGLATCSDGNVLLTGEYIGNIEFGTYTVTGTGSENSFVAKIDTSGNFKWLKTTTGTNLAHAICTTNSVDIYFSGISKGSISLDTISNNPQYTSLYLAKLSDNNLVGLVENDLISFPTIFPNPSAGELTIVAKREVEIVVTNINGQVILQKKLNVGTNRLLMTEHAKGTYFIHSSGSKNSYKLIKD